MVVQTFPANSLSLEVADGRRNCDVTTTAGCRASASRVGGRRGEEDAEQKNVSLFFFYKSLLVLIGVSDVCLAHCITLTRREFNIPDIAEPEALFP